MTPDALKEAGWKNIPSNPFSDLTGPIWTRGQGAERDVGFVGAEKHGNHMGNVNGAMLMALADVALGYRAVDELGQPFCATAQLQVHFVAAARMGELIACRAELVRRTRQLIFLRGLICAGERTVASADGIWKVLEPRPNKNSDAG